MTDQKTPVDQKAMQKTEQELNRLRRGKVGSEEVPDESKERHTEIAVEADKKGGEQHDDKS